MVDLYLPLQSSHDSSENFEEFQKISIMVPNRALAVYRDAEMSEAVQIVIIKLHKTSSRLYVSVILVCPWIFRTYTSQ